MGIIEKKSPVRERPEQVRLGQGPRFLSFMSGGRIMDGSKEYEPRGD